MLVFANIADLFGLARRISIRRLARRLCVIDPRSYSMVDAAAFITGTKAAPDVRR
jgi:fructose transport system ATP-binding protein